MIWLVIGTASLFAWLYLISLHGGFWRADQRLEDQEPAVETWPGVVAVVPARNEADVIERSIGSLLAQDYPGPFAVVLVDDHSDDSTAEKATALAEIHSQGSRLTVGQATTLPPGWTGKMWAVRTGVEAATRLAPLAEYLLLTDADVVHSTGNLRRLVAKAQTERLDLVSLMVKLHCQSVWERLLIPAFVYFFQKLYPLPRVNDPTAPTAGAAGGCMLVRREALEHAGRIEAIHAEVIDDCALGRRLKQRGSIWLGLTESEHSIRPYLGLGDIWTMVARIAYTQLNHSLPLLVGTVVGLALVYLTPPLLALGWSLHGNKLAALVGVAAWLLMARTFLPTLRLYRRSPALAFTLPVAGLLYLAMTLDSALRHWRGQGGSWKGRTASSLLSSRPKRPILRAPNSASRPLPPAARICTWSAPDT